MDLSSLEICQRGIRNLPNVSTVSDMQPTSLAQEQLGDSPWLIFGRKLQGMTTETLLGPRATSLTQPVPEQARPKQLFGMSPTALPWPKPPASSSLFFPYCLWCHQPFLSSWSLFLLHSSYEHDHQLIFLPTSPIASSALHFYYFFFPKSIFQCDSHTVLFLASSSSCLLYLSESHDVEQSSVRAQSLCARSCITWSSSSSSNHMAIWRASTKAMKSQERVQAGPLLGNIGHIFADRIAWKYFFYEYTQIKHLLFILTQALQFLDDTANYFWVARAFY